MTCPDLTSLDHLVTYCYLTYLGLGEDRELLDAGMVLRDLAAVRGPNPDYSPPRAQPVRRSGSCEGGSTQRMI
jgi:hypothetical protein